MYYISTDNLTPRACANDGHAHASESKSKKRNERNLDPRALLLTEGEKSSGEPRNKVSFSLVFVTNNQVSLIGTFMLA